MMKRCLYLLLLLYLPLSTQAQQPKGIWPFRTNQLDKEGKYHGRWKIGADDNKTLLRNGRFRHGREVGTWKYYYPSGKLMMVERRKRNHDYIQVMRYHENGELARVGQARLVTAGNIAWYYWFGDWKVYDINGRFSHRKYYENGKQVVLTLPAPADL